jgi:hypothetical protein
LWHQELANPDHFDVTRFIAQCSLSNMRSVAEIQAEIEKLSRAEQRKLAQWFAQVQADAWDVQIEG